MGNGYPISGVLGSAEVMDLPDVGNMSSTHSANPLACVIGNAVLHEIEERGLIKESARKGELLVKELENIKKEFPERISYILGKGLIASVIFKDPKTGAPDGKLATKISEKCFKKGLLVVHTGRESIKIGPPLTISDEAIIEGVQVMKESIKESIS